jgi:apolipoprotein N-acyltransferase
MKSPGSSTLPASRRDIRAGAPHPPYVTLALCALAAGATLFAFPPIGWWPLILLSPLLLSVAALGSGSTRRVAWMAAVSYSISWLLLHRWLIDVTLMGWPVLAAYMSIYPAAYVALLRRVRLRGTPSTLPLCLHAAAIWTTLEFIRGDMWMDGYPWFLAGHPMVEWPAFAQSTDLFGQYFTSFLVVCGAGALAELWLASEGRGNWKSSFTGCAIALALLAGNATYGEFRLGQSAGMTPGLRVLSIQTNLPQDNKIGWTREEQVRDVAQFVELTRHAFEQVGGEVDLVVWPETMVPGLGLEPENLLFQRQNQLQQEPWLDLMLALHEELGRPLLVGNSVKLGLGLAREDGELQYTWEHSYNSAYLVEGDPPFQRYDKLFLTPFGETMPYISRWAWLERQLLDLGAAGMSFDLEPGERARRIELASVEPAVALATPICFEDTVARVMRRLIWSEGAKAAPVIINLSNDGWFGSFDGGRLQHVQIARFRCIENRAPMVRCANTGLSVHIDSCGRIMDGAVNAAGDEWVMRDAGWLLAEVTLDSRRTLYSIVGELFAWVCLAITVAAIVFTWISGRRKAAPMNALQLALTTTLLLALAGCQQAGGGGSWSSLPERSGRATAAAVETAPAREQPPVPLRVDRATESQSSLGAMFTLSNAAIGVLEQAARSEHPQLRANAIEALHPQPELAELHALEALVDENRGVRFVATMTIGRLKLCNSSQLLEPLLLDESDSVRAAAIFALRTCGRSVDLNPLAKMLRSEQPEVRANAAMVLGLLGDPSAAPMIEQAAGRGLDLSGAGRANAVDLQLAEALLLLGKTEQVHTIRAKLVAPPENQELSAMAAVILGRMKDDGSAGVLERLIFASGDERRPAEVRMACAMALAQLGRPVEIAWISEYFRSDRPEIRQQAAIALGEIGGEQALPALESLLEDDDPLVQVAAAGAILKLERRP